MVSKETVDGIKKKNRPSYNYIGITEVLYSFCKMLAKGDKKTLDVSQYIIVIINIDFKPLFFLLLSIQSDY